MRRMFTSKAVLSLCGFAFLLLLVPQAQAQDGSCRDSWINSAYNQLYHRAPEGSGNSGECNIMLYGGGHWLNFPDLENKIRASKATRAPQGCRDPWITSAYSQLYHRAPQGSGDSGECNPALYGGGHWSSFPDLENKVRASKATRAPQGCRDPWITSAYSQLYHRAPQGSGDSGECNPALYGGGHWSSFPDLENKVRASKGQFNAGSSGSVRLTVDRQGGLRDQNGRLLVAPGQFLISVKNGNGTQMIAPRPGQTILVPPGVITAGGGNVIAAGGGNVIAAGGGNVIAAGGGNMTGNRYGVQSVGRKIVIPALSVH